MASKDGDTVIILSADLISEIVGKYFKDTMFKLPVTIVDSGPADTGYMFTLNVGKVAVAVEKKIPGSQVGKAS